MVEVRTANLTKKFGGVAAVDDVTFTFKDKELTVLVGPSGCGKTTLLRLISGLEVPLKGEIYFGDKLVNDIPPWRRGISMVFQSYALYPNMSVFDNLAFPLKAKKTSKEEIKNKVEEVAKLLDISSFLARKPRELSGGQMQRVAVGRAIIREPDVFLMDEPLSNLDAKLRVYMRTELKRLQKELGITTIYVTHDQAEAMTMSDTLVVMNEGHILQSGDPEEMYRKPRNVFVAGFIGSPSMNFIDCRFDSNNGLLLSEPFKCKAPARIIEALRAKAPEENFILGVRPDDILIDDSNSTECEPVTVYMTEPLGYAVLVTVRAGSSLIKLIAPPHTRLDIEEKCWINFKEEAIHVFDAKTKELIL